jgi:hypothetical protein
MQAWLRAALVAALLIPAPALAQEEFEQATPPDPAKLGKQLGSLEKQLAGHGGGDGKLGQLLKVVKALKSGGKDLKAEDIELLQAQLLSIAENSNNPELSTALLQLAPQLEALKRAKQDPDADDTSELMLDQ